MARAMNDPRSAARLARRAELEAVCNGLARAAAPCLPLARAAADGLLTLVALNDPAVPWPATEMARFVKPVVVIVGDDPAAGIALGPDGWKAAEPIRRWCRWAMIHGAGGEAAHYAAAMAPAALCHRVVLVETSSALAPAWGAFLGAPGLTILPPPGMSHPLAAVLQ
jgi:hypothetical protein